MGKFSSMKPESSGGDYEIPPAGSHPAVLVAIIDLGTQVVSYQGQQDQRPKVLLVWELTAEKQSGSTRNHVIARDYTVSFHEKSALRQLIEKWRGSKFADGEEFNLEKTLGRKCLLSITHGTSASGNNYAKVDGVSAVPKGLSVPEPQNKPMLWEIGDDMDKIPEWVPFLYGQPVSKVIAMADELRGENGHAPASATNGTPAAATASVGNDEEPF